MPADVGQADIRSSRVKRRWQHEVQVAAEVGSILAREFDLQPLPYKAGDSTRYYIVSHNGLCGVVGFISPHSRPFCDGCRRVRLTCTGRLIFCLARGDGIGVSHLLREESPAADERIVRAVERALMLKPARRRFRTSVPMASVGG